MSVSSQFAQSVAAIVLAAGKGTRMKSKTPKVLHKVCGVPMIERILAALKKAGIEDSCLVVSEDYQDLQTAISKSTTAVIQHQRLGTGEAVAASANAFCGENLPKYAKSTLIGTKLLDANYVLICAGDTPALDSSLISDFIKTSLKQQVKLSVIGMQMDNPFGYGRLVCNEKSELIEIVEEKDASEEQKKITLCNSGVIFADRRYLFSCLSQLTNDNKQNEYYLTDCFRVAAKESKEIYVYETKCAESFLGVNDRQQLAAIEAWIIGQKRLELMQSGVSFHLPETCYIEDSVIIEADVEIGPHCSISGHTYIKTGAVISSHCSLHNAHILEEQKLSAYTVINNL